MKTLLVICALVVSTSLCGQITIFTGLNQSSYSDPNDDAIIPINSKTGFQYGINFKVKSLDKGVIQSGIEYITRGATIDGASLGTNVVVSETMRCINVPVTYRLEFPLKDNVSFIAHGGLYFGYAISGRVSVSGSRFDLSPMRFNDGDNSNNRGDMGITLRPALTLRSFIVGLRVDRGFADIYNGNGVLYNTAYGLSIGLVFGGEK